MKKSRVKEFIKNPRKALFRLALPMMIVMLIQTLYNIVDTIFVGRLGADSIAALTFSFPIFFILITISSGIGVGLSSRISRFLGERKKRAAENTAVHGILILTILAVISLISGLIILEPLFQLFGASDIVLGLSIDYMTIILYGALFMFMTATMSNIFSAQGDTKTPMMVHSSSLIMNIILDPIFIFVLGYGVKGAAIATIISFLFGMMLFIYYLNRRSYLEISMKYFRFSKRIVKEIFFVGLPASVMMLLMSIFVIFMNKFMSYFGTEYVATVGIVARLDSVVFLPAMAISFALMTIVGMFYGAKRYDLIEVVSYYSMKVVIVIIAIGGAILFLFPSLLLKIFTPDKEIIVLGTAYLRVVVFYLPFMAVGNIIGRIMQGVGSSLPGFTISITRFIIVPIPLSYIFIFLFGKDYLSVPIATVIGAVISAIIAFAWLKIKLKKLHLINN